MCFLTLHVCLFSKFKFVWHFVYVPMVWLKGNTTSGIALLFLYPPSMDEQPNALYEDLQKQNAALKKAAQREKKKEHLTAGFKKLICILVLLETTWDVIGMIATCKMGSLTGTRIDTAWTPEKIQEIAREGLKLKPSLANDALSDDDVEVLRAKKYVAECKVARWIVDQNLKGITLPASAVMEYYSTTWGMAPHKPKLTTHLAGLAKKQGGKDWLVAFRRRWNVGIGSLPHRPALEPHEIKNKAPVKKSFAAFLLGSN